MKKILEEKNPKVAIIIVSSNALLANNTIKSFEKLTYNNFDIILVDNASNKNSYKILKNEFFNLKIVRLEKKMQFCKSCNKGINKSLEIGAQYMVIAHDDSRDYSVNYLEEVVRTFAEDDKIGMVGTKVFNSDHELVWGGENHKKFGIDMNVPTCGYVIKREVFENVGLLDETLLFNFEDLDFILRLRKAGYKTAFVPSVSYVHVGCGTKSLFGFNFNYLRVRNIFWFMKKHNVEISLMHKLKGTVFLMLTHVKIIFLCCKQKRIREVITVTWAVLKGLIIGIFFPYKEKYKKNKCMEFCLRK